MVGVSHVLGICERVTGSYLVGDCEVLVMIAVFETEGIDSMIDDDRLGEARVERLGGMCSSLDSRADAV